ncbi:MAG TPA: hydroxysqualene dehydroxylase HpnE [Terriglobia bacterium]|nr:hydroxysqualene dehydroxylase HpnE [Terriglobia bacterium]
MDEILIIGGGFAGLAAGVALAGAGRRVRLLEQKPYLGGRARSFRDASTGSIVDNGQHIFMGCYHSTIQFLKTIGTLDRVRFQPRLNVHFAGKEKGTTVLSCPQLPAPWHLLAGVLRSNSFTLGEKLQVLRLGRKLRSADSGSFSDLTVDGWMAKLGQSERLRRNFWDLLCIAALNEDPRIAAAAIFEPVLRLALFQSAADSRIGLASKGLSECYTEAAAAYICARGGQIKLERNVTEFIIEDNRGSGSVCRGVHLSDGTVVESSTVLSAVPCFHLARLLPERLTSQVQFFAGVARMQPSPIISLHLWFDREITALEFAGLRGTTIQWLFNRDKILGSGDRHVSLVISGAHQHIRREKEELLEASMHELREIFPAAREAKVLHSLVIKERFATFSPSLSVVDLRPPAVTPINGLFLAGDWTETGLPATIEGAVKSGYTAAAEIMRRE